MCTSSRDIIRYFPTAAIEVPVDAMSQAIDVEHPLI